MARTNTPDFWSDTMSANGGSQFWLYCICEHGEEESGPCKIGIATNLAKRLSSLQGGNRRALSLVWKIRIGDRSEARSAEERVLMWFRPNCYSCDYKEKLLCSEWVDCRPCDALERARFYLETAHEPIRRAA